MIAASLVLHPGWTAVHAVRDGCDSKLCQTCGQRRGPQRQDTEPFVAVLLRTPDDQEVGGTQRRPRGVQRAGGHVVYGSYVDELPRRLAA